MSAPRGIFETYQTPFAPAGVPQASPFAVAPETQPQSPFIAANSPQARRESPFSVISENESQEDTKTVRLPERRKPAETPFQIAEPQGFGFEAAPQVAKANPFEQAPQFAPPSPFTVENQPAAPSPYPVQAIPYGGWGQNESAQIPAAYAPPSYAQPQAPAPQYPLPASEQSDSFQIKQLELRAIFGVDREMSKDEIVQRARSLPGIRKMAMVSPGDMAAVDALKQVISNLGLGSGSLRLYSGAIPIEFIREGSTLLAVQTDGGFAPGVRETLMLVARELSR